MYISIGISNIYYKKTYKFDALVVQLGMVLVRRMTVRNMLPMQ